MLLGHLLLHVLLLLVVCSEVLCLRLHYTGMLHVERAGDGLAWTMVVWGHLRTGLQGRVLGQLLWMLKCWLERVGLAELLPSMGLGSIINIQIQPLPLQWLLAEVVLGEGAIGVWGLLDPILDICRAQKTTIRQYLHSCLEMPGDHPQIYLQCCWPVTWLSVAQRPVQTLHVHEGRPALSMHIMAPTCKGLSQQGR